MDRSNNIKELEITFRLKNNRLKERRVMMGLTAKELARHAGINYTTYLRYEGLDPKAVIFNKARKYNGQIRDVYNQKGRICKAGDWNPIVKILAKFYKTTPKELFPESILNIQKNSIEKKIDAADLCPLLENHNYNMLCAENPETLLDNKEMDGMISSIRKTLRPKENEIIDLYVYDNKTLDEIGAIYGVHRERARQIKEQALGKIRRGLRDNLEKQKVTFRYGKYAFRSMD
jgi:RNA polymerase sigma factor (sigma-70 family)